MAVKGKKRKAANNSAAKSAAKKTKKALTPTDINNYEALIKSSKQNANHIVTLINCIKENRGRSSQSALRVAATQALRRVFNHASEKGDLVLSNKAIATTKNAAIEKYQKWLKSLFEKYTSLLLASMDEDDVGLQLSSVHALMDAIKIECMGKQRGTTMTTGILSKFVLAMIVRPSAALSSELRDEFLMKFVRSYDDIRYFTLKQIQSIINDAIAATSNLVENEDKNENGDGNQKDKESTSTSSIFSTTTPHDLSRNLMEVLLRIKVPASSGNVFISDKKESLTVSVQRKQLSCCWDEFLKLSFPVDVYKNALIHMQQHILPALSSPLLMADFLTDSYNLGGIISILALEGLFTLIARHNLDYPHFFHKLYRLLTPEVFYARYRTKFYSLLSLFLTSTHLPSYLVAAFAKRLARLALSAPPSGCVFSVALIFNLLRRHPACRYLIHNPLEEANNEGEKGKGVAGADNKTSLVLSRLGLNLAAAKAKAEEKAEEEAEEEEVKGEDNDDQDNDEEAAEESSDEEEMPPGVDPYDHNEEDPALSQANESSLWELKSLCNHYIPAVSRLAKVFFEANVPKKDYDMKEEQFSAQSYETMFHTELVWRKNQNTPMAFEVPQTLFDFDKDDRVFADNFF